MKWMLKLTGKHLWSVAALCLFVITLTLADGAARSLLQQSVSNKMYNTARLRRLISTIPADWTVRVCY